MAAPGEQITSTFPGGQWATGSGTSMAAPLVAATAALLRETLPSRDVARRIERYAVSLCAGALSQVDA